MLKKRCLVGFVLFFVAAIITYLSGPASAQTPGIISYQGRVLVNNAPFTGTGKFKFALVDSGGTTTFWSHDGTNGEPANTIDLTVTNGLYSVLLGDTTVTNMSQAVPESVFGNSDVRLRIWFNDGTNGNKLLTPDQRIAAVGYALIAKTVDPGAITPSMVAVFPKAKARRDATQVIPHLTSTRISFDAEEFDTNSIFDAGNATRLTCKEAGTYLVIAQLIYSSPVPGQFRQLTVVLNDDTANGNLARQSSKSPSNQGVQLNASVLKNLGVGDFVDLRARHDAGEDVNLTSAFLSMTKIP